MNKNLLRRICCGMLALTMLFLAACGKTDTASTGSDTVADTSSVVDTGNDTQVTTEIEMPTADLSKNSKVLHVYSWCTMSEEVDDGVASEYFKKEFGVTFKETIATHEAYWVDLAKMVAAGNAPDVVNCAYDKYWTTPVSDGLLEPWDGLIDFNTPLWADTKDTIESIKWKDKIYFPVLGEYIHSWLYYNKNMFKNYGLEDMTPRALYEKGEWTLDKFLEISNKFVEKNNKNEIVQWGFTPQNLEPLSISGVQIVEVNNGTSYKNNLRDARIAKVMNAFYTISAAGTGSMSVKDACPLFEQEKAAMLMSHADLLVQRRFEPLRQADAMGFAPLPRLEKDGKHVVEVNIDPGFGLGKGAKNKELAALWMNYLKWFHLGDNFCHELPKAEKSIAEKHYNIKPKAGSVTISKEDEEFIKKFLATNPERVPTTYRSVVRNFGELLEVYKWQIFAGAVQWSAAVQQMYPTYEARLKELVK